MKYRIVIVAAAGMLIAAAFAASAVAAKPTKAFISIDGLNPHYFGNKRGSLQGYDISGRIESSKSPCKVGRRVVVYREAEGRDDKLGYDVSDSNGGWSLFLPGESFDFNTRYYAQAPKRKLRGNKSCAEAVSDPESFTPPT